jgi:hypothetical protein
MYTNLYVIKADYQFLRILAIISPPFFILCTSFSALRPKISFVSSSSATKDKKTKFHSLVIGNTGNKNTIEEFDSNWVYDSNNSDHVLQLVRDINGIYNVRK